MTEKQRTSRNNKLRGKSAERALAKLMNEKGIPVKRTALSGALKKYVENLPGTSDLYRGDIILPLGKCSIRIEVKTRQSLPKYVTNFNRNGKIKSKKEQVKKIKNLCVILNLQEFISLLQEGKLPDYGIEIDSKRCKGLIHWFNQDESQIVAMKEYGQRTWYFAIKVNVLNKLSRRFKTI